MPHVKTIITALIVGAAAITCAVLLRVDHPSRYQLYGIDETSSADGKTVKSVYRLDTISGKAWRISSKPYQFSQDAQGKPMINWADGWEEMPESPDAAVAKSQQELQREKAAWQQQH